ncbi:triose-phosphate isomerase family protein [Allobranchiibius sp. GilTou38]|uniref:triose-phosphate isomerase family protein n=1 Tax=Allobranchiibius sp. GilTou38 TaxID=2815210 RepID=UPI0032605A7C
MSGGPRPPLVGVSLKMYFGPARAVEWAQDVVRLAAEHDSTSSGTVDLFVLPSMAVVPAVLDIATGTRVQVGAQDLFWEDRGAFTGGISGADLRDIGCTLVEVGHVERRRFFGEDDATIARKFAAAVRNRLTPVLCLGEREPGATDDAVADCIRQLTNALADLPDDARADVVLAYEPEWAIGRAEPADAQHIGEVTRALREYVRGHPVVAGSRVIYGGSAAPGLWTLIHDSVDGLFLGRFAHDVTALRAILDEITAIESGVLS